MAYGNLLDYTPAPAAPGAPPAYDFLTKSGQKFRAFGAEAEAMKQRLDQAKAAGPQPTAGIIGPQALVTSSAQPAQPAVRADFAAPVPGAGPTFNAKAEAANLVGAPPPAPPPPPPSIARPAGMPGTQPIAPGHRFNPETGLIEAYRGGSGGSKGGWRDTSRSVRGGFDPNAEYVQTVEGAMRRGSDAEQLGVQGDQALADAEHSAAFKTALHYDDAVRQAADRADAIESRVRELDANYERLNKDYNGSKVDPGRLFAGGRNWVHGILAGLGTFGAGMAGRPSMTMQVLQQRIANDIDAQRAEIAVKRDAADNAYKRLLQETGSDDLARKALHGLQLERIRSEAEVMAKDGSDKKRQAQGQALLAAADQRIAKFREDYRQASLGEVTKGMVYVPASPGRPAGWYPVSDQLAADAKIVAGQQARANLAKTQAEAAAGPDAASPLPAERTKVIGLNAQLLDQGEAVLKLLPTEDTSEWGDPASGPIDTSTTFGNGVVANKLTEATTRLATTHQAGAGMGSTADDTKRAELEVGSGGSVAERKRGAQAAMQAAAKRIVLELSTVPPAQRDAVINSMSPVAQAYVRRELGQGGAQ